MGKDNVSALYDELKNRYKLGTEDDFRRSLTKPENRTNLYNAIKDEYEVGDPNSFDDYLGFHPGENIPASTSDALNRLYHTVDEHIAKNTPQQPIASPTLPKLNPPVANQQTAPAPSPSVPRTPENALADLQDTVQSIKDGTYAPGEQQQVTAEALQAKQQEIIDTLNANQPQFGLGNIQPSIIDNDLAQASIERERKIHELKTQLMGPQPEPAGTPYIYKQFDEKGNEIPSEVIKDERPMWSAVRRIDKREESLFERKQKELDIASQLFELGDYSILDEQIAGAMGKATEVAKAESQAIQEKRDKTLSNELKKPFNVQGALLGQQSLPGRKYSLAPSEVEVLSAKSPSAIAEKITNGIDQDLAIAFALGQKNKIAKEHPEYDEETVNNKAWDAFQQRIYEQVVQSQANEFREGKSDLAMAAINAIAGTSLFQLVNAALQAQGADNLVSMQTAVQDWSKEQKEKGWWNYATKVTTSDIGAMVIDPLTALSGGTGGAAAKAVMGRAAKKYIAQGVSEGAANRLAALETRRLFSKMANSKILNPLVKNQTKAKLAAGTANFATFETTHEAVNQIEQGKFDPVSLSEALGKGVALGGVFGSLENFIGNATTKAVANSATREAALAKRALGTGAKLASEISVFSVAPAIQLMADGHSFGDAVGEAVLDNTAFILGMKASHAVTNPKGTFAKGASIFTDPQQDPRRRAMDQRTHWQRVADRLIATPEATLDHDERKALADAGYPDLAQFGVAASKEMAEKIEQGKATMEDVDATYTKLAELMVDDKVPLSAKAKISYAVTGKGIPEATIIGQSLTQGKDGRWELKTYDKDGRTLTYRTYGSKNEGAARRAYEAAQEQSRINRLFLDEQAAQQAAKDEVMKGVNSEIANEIGVPLDAVEGDTNVVLQDYKDRLMEERGYENDPAAQKRAILEKEYNISFDNAFGKDPSRRTAFEQAAISDYQYWLDQQKAIYHDNKKIQAEQSKAIEETHSKAYWYGYRNSNPSQVYKYANDGTTEQKREMLKGIDDQLRHKAMVDAYAQAVALKMHVGNEDGMLQKALTTEGKIVYVTRGKVIATPDRKGIDYQNSHKTPIVFNPETNKQEQITIKKLVSVGQPYDPMSLDRAYPSMMRYNELKDELEKKANQAAIEDKKTDPKQETKDTEETPASDSATPEKAPASENAEQEGVPVSDNAEQKPDVTEITETKPGEFAIGTQFEFVGEDGKPAVGSIEGQEGDMWIVINNSTNKAEKYTDEQLKGKITKMLNTEQKEEPAPAPETPANDEQTPTPQQKPQSDEEKVITEGISNVGQGLADSATEFSINTTTDWLNNENVVKGLTQYAQGAQSVEEMIECALNDNPKEDVARRLKFALAHEETKRVLEDIYKKSNQQSEPANEGEKKGLVLTEDGMVDFDQSEPAAAWDKVVEDVEGDVETAQKVIQAEISDIDKQIKDTEKKYDKAISDAKKNALKGSNYAERIANTKANNATIGGLQKAKQDAINGLVARKNKLAAILDEPKKRKVNNAPAPTNPTPTNTQPLAQQSEPVQPKEPLQDFLANIGIDPTMYDQGDEQYPNQPTDKQGRIVSENGKPMTLYHGTQAQITLSDLEPGHTRADGEQAQFNGVGIASFTPDKSVAEEYALSNDGAHGPVLESQITLKKPFVKYGVNSGWTPEQSKQFAERLKAEGYDGIIVYSSKQNRQIGGKPIEIIPFNKESISEPPKPAMAGQKVTVKKLDGKVGELTLMESQGERWLQGEDGYRLGIDEKGQVTPWTSEHNVTDERLALAVELANKPVEAHKKKSEGKDYTPFQVGQSIIDRYQQSKKFYGSEDEQVLENGESIKGRYVLHEANAITPSHDPFNNYVKSIDYPVDENGNTTNDRDYERDKSAQDANRERGKSLDQRAIQKLVFIGKHGAVISGNDRTMASQLAAANGADEKYINYIVNFGAKKFGFTPEQVAQFKHPRISFEIDQDLPFNAETLAKFNAREMKAQGSTETAVKLGKIIPENIFNQILTIIGDYETFADYHKNKGDLTRTIALLRDAGVINENDMPAIIEEGEVTPMGKDLIERALVGKVFAESPDTLRRLASVPSLRQSVIYGLKAITENSKLSDKFSLINDLSLAIELTHDARNSGYKAGDPVSDFSRQSEIDIETGETKHKYDFTNIAMQTLADVLNGTKVKGLKEFIELYNKKVKEADAGQMDMFSSEPLTKESIFKDLKAYIQENGKRNKRKSAAQPAEQSPGQAEPPRPTQPADSRAAGNSESQSAPGGLQGSNGPRLGQQESARIKVARGQHEKAKAEAEEKKKAYEAAKSQAESMAKDKTDAIDKEIASLLGESDPGKVGRAISGEDEEAAQYLQEKVSQLDPDKQERIRSLINQRQAAKQSVANSLDNLRKEWESADKGAKGAEERLNSAIEDERLKAASTDDLINELIEVSKQYNQSAKDLGAEDKSTEALHSKGNAICEELMRRGVSSDELDQRLANAGIKLKPTAEGLKKEQEKLVENPTLENLAQAAQKGKEIQEQNSTEDELSNQNGNVAQEAPAHYGPTLFQGDNEDLGGLFGGTENPQPLANPQDPRKKNGATSTTAAPAQKKNSGNGLFDSLVARLPLEENDNGGAQSTLQGEINQQNQQVNPTPTPAQKEAGNYKKGHINVAGYDITIENPIGSTRSGTDEDGNQWSVEMKNTYGYIRGTEGKDGDHLDVFLHPDMDKWSGEKIYVVDQYNQNGTFDEHKVMLGFDSKEDALKAYLSNYEPGWEESRKIEITEVGKDDFDQWVKNGDKKTRPFEEYAQENYLQYADPVQRAVAKMTDEQRIERVKELRESLEQFLLDEAEGKVEPNYASLMSSLQENANELQAIADMHPDNEDMHQTLATFYKEIRKRQQDELAKAMSENGDAQGIYTDQEGISQPFESENPGAYPAEEPPHPLLAPTRTLDETQNEFCLTERTFTDKGYYGFMRGEKIESAEDVAYIFSQLENAYVENGFALLVKDGKGTVIHVGMGEANRTVVDNIAIKVAAERMGADKVYVIHNHPSGTLRASSEDKSLMGRLQKMLPKTEVKGIIIDLKGGKFVEFDPKAETIKQALTDHSGDTHEKRLRLFAFDGRNDKEEYDPQNMDLMVNAPSIVDFIQDHRLGNSPKLSVLCLNQGGKVVANLITPFDLPSEDGLAAFIAANLPIYGASSAIVYGDFDRKKAPYTTELYNKVKELSGDNIRLFDVVTASGNHFAKGKPYLSYTDHGYMEPAAPYGKSEVKDPAGGNEGSSPKEPGGVIEDGKGTGGQPGRGNGDVKYSIGATKADGTANVELLTQLAEHFGRKVAYEEIGDSSIGGYYDGKGKITLNSNASDNIKQGMATVLGHELTHSAEGASGFDKITQKIAKSKMMADWLFDNGYADLKEATKAIVDRYQAKGVKLDEKGAEKEVIANFVGEKILSDEKTARRMMASEPWIKRIGQQMLDWVSNAINTLTGRQPSQARELRQIANRLKRALESTSEIADRISKKNYIGKAARAQYEALLDSCRPDLTPSQKKEALDYLHSLENNKDNNRKVKIAVHWLANGDVMLPNDMHTIDKAIKVAQIAKVDPYQYDGPRELLEAHSDIKIKQKPINPDTVKTLHKTEEYPEQGIVVYNVDEGVESRQALREIINSHWGEDANPWCLLQGDGEGNLTEQSQEYWDNYNSIPKQIAFKDGKLLAFRATDQEFDHTEDIRKGVRDHMYLEYGLNTIYDPENKSLRISVPMFGEDDVIVAAERLGIIDSTQYDDWVAGRDAGFIYADVLRNVEYALEKEAIGVHNEMEAKIKDADLNKVAYEDRIDSWWNRMDKSSVGIPFLKDMGDGWKQRYHFNPSQGEAVPTENFKFRGDPKNGRYEVMGDGGWLKNEYRENGKPVGWQSWGLPAGHMEFSYCIDGIAVERISTKKGELTKKLIYEPIAGKKGESRLIWMEEWDGKDIKYVKFPHQDGRTYISLSWPDKNSSKVSIYTGEGEQIMYKDGDIVGLGFSRFNMRLTDSIHQGAEIPESLRSRALDADALVGYTLERLENNGEQTKADLVNAAVSGRKNDALALLDKIRPESPVPANNRQYYIGKGEKSDKELGNAVVDMVREGGIEVSTDIEEMRRELGIDGKPKDFKELVEQMTAWHGSPYKFEQFDHSKMGTGEGAQAHGLGTYVALNKGTAKKYALLNYGASLNISRLGWEISRREEKLPFIRDKELREQLIEEINKYKSELQQAQKGTHNLYEVEVPDDNGKNYIYEDKEVPQELYKSIEDELQRNGFDLGAILGYGPAGEVSWNSYKENGLKDGRSMYSALSYLLGGGIDGSHYKGSQLASELLHKLGLAGIKYDGHSDGPCAVIFNEKDLKIVNRTELMKTRNGEVYGFVKNGKMYLDPGLMNANTPIHEYTHLWDKALQKADSKLWERGKQLLKQTDLWQEIKNSDDYKDIVTDEDLLASEVHARLAGPKGEELLKQMMANAKTPEQKSLVTRIKEWLKEALAKVRDAFSGDWDSAKLRSLTIEEFAQMPIKDLAEGRKLDFAADIATPIEKLFIGERGAANLRLAATDNIEIARQMEDEGKDEKAIKLATGWERGADGKWRYETPDVKLSKKANKIIDEAVENLPYEQIYQKEVADAPYNGRSEETRDWYQRELDKMVAKRTNVPLGDVIDDSEILKAYPQLGNISVTFDFKGEGIGGSFNSETKSLMINLDFVDEGWTIESILGHELQHAIQAEEGFARGGSGWEFGTTAIEQHLQDFKKKAEEKVGPKPYEARQLEDKINSLMDDIFITRETYGFESQEYKKVYAEYRETRDALNSNPAYIEWVKKKYEIPELVEQERKRVEELHKDHMGWGGPYKYFSGEVESRNVQTRLDYTPAQRRSTLASETEDVDRALHLILHDRGTSAFIGKKAREQYEKLLDAKRPDLSEEEKTMALDYLHSLEDTKENNRKVKIAVRWLANGGIMLPNDMHTVDRAIKVADIAKVDPMSYPSPHALLEAHDGVKIKSKPINPDTVPTLRKVSEMPEHGIAIYDVDESQESREAMRQIINTHWGEAANPWCLLGGNGYGQLAEGSELLWYNRYNTIPKQVAFKDGKLHAFRGSSQQPISVFNKENKKVFADEIYKAYGIKLYPLDGYDPYENQLVELSSDNNFTEAEWSELADKIGVTINLLPYLEWKKSEGLTIDQSPTEHYFYPTTKEIETHLNYLAGKRCLELSQSKMGDYAYQENLETWWDREDINFVGLPIRVKQDDGWIAYRSIVPGQKELTKPKKLTKGNKQNGTYEEIEGKKYELTTFRNGIKHGLHEKKKNGKFETRDWYNNGEVEESAYYDWEGQLEGLEIGYIDERGEYQLWNETHENGNLKGISPARGLPKIRFKEDGSVEIWNITYRDGALVAVGRNKDINHLSNEEKQKVEHLNWVMDHHVDTNISWIYRNAINHGTIGEDMLAMLRPKNNLDNESPGLRFREPGANIGADIYAALSKAIDNVDKMLTRKRDSNLALTKEVGPADYTPKRLLQEYINAHGKNTQKFHQYVAENYGRISRNRWVDNNGVIKDPELFREVTNYFMHLHSQRIENLEKLMKKTRSEQDKATIQYAIDKYTHALSEVMKAKYQPEEYFAHNGGPLDMAMEDVANGGVSHRLNQYLYRINEDNIKCKPRTAPPPKNTGIGYKVFFLGKDGKLYPPMVKNQGGASTPVGIWLDAEAADIVGYSKTGRPKVKAGGKGTQGGSGELAYRPGWHLGEIPYALQFNRLNPETGAKDLFPGDFVWAEVEYAKDHDYQEEAMSYGYTENGNFQHSLAGLPRLPIDGAYKYRTNPNPETDPWIITGAMKVNRILKPSEVDELVRKAGREPQQRVQGAITDEQVATLQAEAENRPKVRQQMITTAQEQCRKLGLDSEVYADVAAIQNTDFYKSQSKENQERLLRGKGVYDIATGKLHIVADNHTDIADITQTIAHEGIAHRGMRELVAEMRGVKFGTKEGERAYEDFLTDVFYRLDKKNRDWVLKYTKGSENLTMIHEAMDERFGALAEKGFDEFTAPEQGLWKKLKIAVQNALNSLMAKAGLDVKITLGDNELRYMLWRSKERLERNAMSKADQQRDAEMHEALKIGQGLRFRDGDSTDEIIEKIGKNAPNKRNETYDIWNDRSLSLDEMITRSKLRLLASHQDSKELRSQAFLQIVANFADIQKGLRESMRQQKGYDISATKRVADLARMLLESKLIIDETPGETKRLLSAVYQATGKEDIAKQIDQVMDVMSRNQLRFAQNEFEKLNSIKDKKLNAQGVEVAGMLDPKGQSIIKAFRDGRALSEKALEEAISKAYQNLSSNENAIKEDAENKLIGYHFAERYHSTIKASEAEEIALREDLKEAIELKEAGQMDKEQLREYRQSIEAALMQNRIERIQAYWELSHDFSDEQAEGIKRAIEFRQNQLEIAKEIQHDANRDMEGRDPGAMVDYKKETIAQKLVSRGPLEFVLSPLSTFDQMLRMAGSHAADGEGYLHRRFMRQWNQSRDNEILGFRAKVKALDEKAAEILGKGKNWADLMKYAEKLPHSSVDVLDGKEKKRLDLSQGKLLYISMVDRMEDGAMKLRKMGISEQEVKMINDFLDPKLKEVADWLVNEFLPESRNAYNETHKRVFGASMAAVENYFPLRILKRRIAQSAEDLDKEGLGIDANSISTATGAIKKRTRNSMPLDLLNTDALATTLDHLQEMEHWNAFAEFNRDINSLRTYNRFKNQMLNITSAYGSGPQLWQRFNDCCNMAAGTYRPKGEKTIDEFALKIAQGVTAAKVSMRINTALKQLLSLPAFCSDANPLDLAKSMATCGASFKWAYENLPQFRERWESRVSGDPKLAKEMMSWTGWRKKAMELSTRVGMMPNAAIDAMTCAIGAKAVYDRKLRLYKADGYDQAKAELLAKIDAQNAFNSSQQSSEGAFLSPMQRDKTWYSVMLSVFRNAAMSYSRQTYDALRNLKHNATPKQRAESIEFMARQLESQDGLSKDQAMAAAKKRMSRQIFKDVVRTALFGWGLNGLWSLGGYATYLLLGDDDKEKDEMKGDVLARASVAPMEGLAGGDVISNFAATMLNDRSLSGLEGSLDKNMPVTSDIVQMLKKYGRGQNAEATNDMINLIVSSTIGTSPKTIEDAICGIWEASRGDEQLAHQSAMAVCRVLNCPESQVKKLYFDDVNLTAEQAKGLSPKQIAEQYAKTQVAMGLGVFAPWLWNDPEVISNKLSSPTRQIKERMESLIDKETVEQYQLLNDSWSDVKAAEREWNQALGKPQAMALAGIRRGQIPAERWAKYNLWKTAHSKVEELASLFMDSDTPEEAMAIFKALEKGRKNLVKGFNQGDNKAIMEAIKESQEQIAKFKAKR